MKIYCFNQGRKRYLRCEGIEMNLKATRENTKNIFERIYVCSNCDNHILIRQSNFLTKGDEDFFRALNGGKK